MKYWSKPLSQTFNLFLQGGIWILLLKTLFVGRIESRFFNWCSMRTNLGIMKVLRSKIAPWMKLFHESALLDKKLTLWPRYVIPYLDRRHCIQIYGFVIRIIPSYFQRTFKCGWTTFLTFFAWVVVEVFDFSSIIPLIFCF